MEEINCASSEEIIKKEIEFYTRQEVEDRMNANYALSSIDENEVSKIINEAQDYMGWYHSDQPKMFDTFKYNPYSQYLRESVCEVGEKYPLTIDVKGDGNCFYRSAILHFLLKIFKPCEKDKYPKDQVEAIFRMIQDIDSIGKQSDSIPKILLPRNFYQFKTEDIKMIFLMNLKHTLQDLLNCKDGILNNLIDVMRVNISFDISSVVIVRLLIYQTFMKNLRNPSLTQFRDKETLQQIKNLILEFGTQAEDLIIKCTSEALKSQLIVQNLYEMHNANNKIVNNQLIFDPLSNNNKNSFQVAVLYTNGHYMCLIDKEYIQNNILMECHRQKESNSIREEQIFLHPTKSEEKNKLENVSANVNENTLILSGLLTPEEIKKIKMNEKNKLCNLHKSYHVSAIIESHKKEYHLNCDGLQIIFCEGCFEDQIKTNNSLDQDFFSQYIESIQKRIVFQKDKNLHLISEIDGWTILHE